MEKSVRRSLAFRAWALEATWHPERMQGHGVLYALLPVLRVAADRRAALGRHAGPFSCNLWTAPALLGAMAGLEARGQGEAAAALRDRLSGPLSAAGDHHVWTAMRPACLLFGAAGLLAGQPWFGLGASTFCYASSLLARWRRGFATGLALGAELEGSFGALRPSPRLESVLRAGLAAAAGALAAWGSAGGGPGAFLMPGALVVGYTAARRAWSPGIVFWLLVVLVSLLRRFSNPVGLP